MTLLQLSIPAQHVLAGRTVRQHKQQQGVCVGSTLKMEVTHPQDWAPPSRLHPDFHSALRVGVRERHSYSTMKHSSQGPWHTKALQQDLKVQMVQCGSCNVHVVLVMLHLLNQLHCVHAYK